MNQESDEHTQNALSRAKDDPRFTDYYAKESQSAQTLARFEAICETVLRVLSRVKRPERLLEVADIGCGAGTLSMMWAAHGHHVHGLDVNESLLKLARERAVASGLSLDFRAGSAVALPWADASMDVCILPELLEHVADWRACLRECGRVLRPGGVLYVSTSNKLCPVQYEFNLPMYSWYPAPLKRRYERLAVTTRPDLANYAKYPAVNWFTFFGLRRDLARLGFSSLDRFDLVRTASRGWAAWLILTMIAAFPPLRWLAHVATPYTVVLATKVGTPSR